MAAPHRFFAVIGVLALVMLSMAQPRATPKLSGWAVPVNLGPIINSPFLDGGPVVSKNGLSLFFHSTRPNGFGAQDIWVSRRPARNAPWGAPTNLGPHINTAGPESVPVLSRDEHWLFFNAERPGGMGSGDIWASWRANVHDDLGWGPPINLGPGVNSVFNEVGAGYFENDDAALPVLFFGSTRPDGLGGVGTDIWSSQAVNGVFGPAHLVAELSTPALDARPVPRFDGLELFLGSSRPGTFGGLDLWVATRNTIAEPWSTPVNLGGLVNTASGDQQPFIAPDRQILFFASDRPGGLGGLDLYVTARPKTGNE